jgi:hypothetical protein
LIDPHGYISCLLTNTRAAAFYEKYGFVPSAVYPGDCEGYPCEVLRLCLPTSRHRERAPQPYETSLVLAGFSAENWGHAERDAEGVWRWVA